MKNGKALALAAGLVGCATLAAAQAERSGKVAEVFAERCAACHGAQLQGGQAKSLLDDEWRYGGDDATLATSIREGRLDAGMPPFGAMMSEQETRALVIFIREKADAARRAKSVFAKPQADTVVTSAEHAFKVETVAEGLDTPWSIAFLPDGRMLVTEKPGRLRIVEMGKPPEPVFGVPAVWSIGQGGLLDVAVHPDYATNGWIYLSYSHAGPDASAMTRVMRARLKGDALVDQETLFAPPVELYRSGSNHFGSRFVFDGKGHLFFTIGEREHRDDAQDLSRPNGKVHRIFDDGRVPEDNPFVKTPGAIPTIWSYGHRNPQGLARHPRDGRALRRRARPARRRRAEPGPARAQLRLAGHHLRHELRRHSDHGPHREGGHGAAGDSTGRRRSPCARSTSTSATASRAGRTTCWCPRSRRRNCGGCGSRAAGSSSRRCCSRASAASATSWSDPTGSCTWLSTRPTGSRGWSRCRSRG